MNTLPEKMQEKRDEIRVIKQIYERLRTEYDALLDEALAVVATLPPEDEKK